MTDDSKSIPFAAPSELHFRERKDGLWEKVVDGEVVGVYRSIDTKPPPWPGAAASPERKAEWEAEAEAKIARADAPGVEMFFAIGSGPIPDMVFVEPVPETEGS